MAAARSRLPVAPRIGPKVALLGLLSLWVPVAAAASSGRALGAARIAGFVRDPAGSGVAGARVFVLEPKPRPATVPVAETLTDERGRFELAGIAPGVYRLAALKHGYAAALAQVRASAGAWLDLVLEPLPPDAVPEDASWVLRLPRRSVLREEAPTPAFALEGPRFELPRMQASIEGAHVEQHFAWERSGSGAAPEGGLAAMTRVELAAALGAAARVRFQGGHERYRLGDEPRRRSEGSMGRLVLDIEPGGRDRVQAAAFYRGASGPVPLVAAPLAAAGRDWGYLASWARELRGEGQVEIGLEARNVDWPGGESAWSFESGDVAQHMLVLDSAFERHTATGHRLRLAARARRDGWRKDGVRPPGAPGWTVALRGEDQWQAGAHWNLRALLHAQADLSGDAPVAWLPGFGVAWTAARAHGEVAFVQPLWAGGGVSGGEPGYHVRAGGRLPGNLSIFGETLYEPLRGVFGEERSPLVTLAEFAGPVAALQGLVPEERALRRQALGLERGFASATLRIRLERGHIETREPVPGVFVVAGLGDPQAATRVIAFTQGEVALDLHATGTRLIGVVERVGAGTRATWYEVRVAQPLYWLDASPGTWRVLIAARRAQRVALGSSLGQAVSEQFRAGISLAF